MYFLKFISLSLCLFFNSYTVTASSIQIIINPDNQQQTISQQSIRAIFSMRWRTWEDGTAIRVFVLKDDNQFHAKFTKEYIGVFPHQLRKAWDRLVFSGTGQAPVQVDSIEEMLKKINSTPGAIGYITTEKVNESVKTISLK